MDLDTQIITVFCRIDDALKQSFSGTTAPPERTQTSVVRC